MLSGKTAVVTGASRGIGRAVAQRLAGAGAEVVGLGRDPEALAETAGSSPSIATMSCDVTSEPGVEAVFAEIGRVDVLVNNAGIATSNPLHRTTLEEWERTHAVNATGAFLCTKAVLPGMLERRWGRIVTVASTASHAGARYIAAYAASKHAVLGLMRSVAAEVAGSGVTANAVCPTYVRTSMTERTIATIAAKTGTAPADAEETLVGSSPLGRLVEPDEVADVVVFLAAEAAGAINGQSIILDGGGIQQ